MKISMIFLVKIFIFIMMKRRSIKSATAEDDRFAIIKNWEEHYEASPIGNAGAWRISDSGRALPKEYNF